jgi:hypothetical protein
VTISDWASVAWTVVSDQAPLMANPFEYREALWSILYKGEDPPPSRRPDPPARSRRGRHQPPPKPGPARPMTRTESSALAALDAQVAEIAARRNADDTTTTD